MARLAAFHRSLDAAGPPLRGHLEAMNGVAASIAASSIKAIEVVQVLREHPGTFVTAHIRRHYPDNPVERLATFDDVSTHWVRPNRIYLDVTDATEKDVRNAWRII